MDVDMDKTAQQNELPPYCKDASAAFKKTFAETEKLYHYTSFESAVKILSTGKLLYSDLKKQNDFNESHRPCYEEYTWSLSNLQEEEENEEKLSEVLQHFQQISLVMDKKRRLGFDIPAMWTHYAQRGNGICLVFNKNMLEEQLMPGRQNEILDFGKIKYKQKYDPSIILPSTDDIDKRVDYVFRRRGKIFFQKSSDWSYEQEFRIIRKKSSQAEGLNISDALTAVILCNVQHSEQEEQPYSLDRCNEICSIKDCYVCCYDAFLGNRILSCDGEQVWSSEDQYATDTIEKLAENLDV